MTTPSSDNTSPTGTDTTTAVQFLNDLLVAASSRWMEQAARWSDIYHRMREGTYSATQLQQDLSRLWDPWLALAAFPAGWWMQNSQQLPTIFILVDAVAETVGPVEARLNASVLPWRTPEVGPLQRIGGPTTGTGTGVFAPKFIQLGVSPEGNRLFVTLVELGGNKEARGKNGIEPGLYMGLVSVKEVALRRPLVLLYVFIDEPSEDESEEEPESA